MDGSDCSRTALEFALDEAVLRKATVHGVVAALPEDDYWAAVDGMSPALVDELAADLERMPHGMVDAVVGERGGAAAKVPCGGPRRSRPTRRVLVDQSRDADLLVVGHRGRGGFRGNVLGSVGLQCVLHASVPVTVVRPGTVTTAGNALSTAHRARGDLDLVVPRRKVLGCTARSVVDVGGVPVPEWNVPAPLASCHVRVLGVVPGGDPPDRFGFLDRRNRTLIPGMSATERIRRDR